MYRARAQRVIVALAAASMVICACGSDRRASDSVQATSPLGTTPVTASTTSTSTTSSSAASTSNATVPVGTTAPNEGSAPMVTGPMDPGLQPYIDIAVADLAQRLGVAADQIVVSSATLKEWPDSSLGCPQKGMVYTQVMTDGALIVLTVGAKAYNYHAGGSRPPFYCADSKATPSG